jgi:protein-S-isoprenylcysteine O-methyltransferase Ste14
VRLVGDSADRFRFGKLNDSITRTRKVIAWAANFTERWILSFVFFCLASMEFTKVWMLTVKHHDTPNPFVDPIHHVILFILGIFSAFLLLIARRPSVPPERLKFIFIPLITTFYTVLYYTVQGIDLFGHSFAWPAALRAPLYPAEWQKPLVAIGLAIILLGNLISLWGLIYLRRSFGVFVTVRKIVLNGPYRWVHHPMYLGWVCICIGVAIANFSISYFLLTGGHMALLMYRARLEENRLAEHSPEYRDYMQRSGFIFPKLFVHR